MKTFFNKRRFLAALSAALLIFAALIAGCMNEFDEQNKPDGDIIIPKGKGIVRISVADPEARSILPSLPATNTMHYKVEFKKDGTVGGNTATDTDFPAAGRAEFGNLSGQPIALNAGTYNITITAWSAATAGNALAGWTGSAVVISGSSSSVAANLKGWTADGKGTFSYSITVPALPVAAATAPWSVTTPPSAYSTKKMEIFTEGGTLVSMDSEGASISSILTNVGTANTGSISLPSGYYEVKITLEADKCQDRVVTNALHIYNTMTSSYSYSVPTINQDKFSVAFSLNGQTDNNSITTTTQGNISFLGTVTNPGNPGNSGFTFGGWFDNSAGTGTAWAFGVGGTPVLKDTTLYAKWNPKADTPITPGAIGGVTVPAAGAVPAATVTETTEYTGTITWDDPLSNGTPATFAPSTVYTATITLSPKPGYTLTGVVADSFTVTGATSATNADDSGVITAVFPATAATTINAVINITFTGDTDMSITTTDSTTVTYSDLANPSGSTSITFTLGGGPFSPVTWKYGTVTVNNGTTTGLTIDKTSNLLPYLVSGTHIINVSGTKDSHVYSGTITIVVN